MLAREPRWRERVRSSVTEPEVLAMRTPPSSRPNRTIRALAVLAAATGLLLIAVVPAAAKEFLQARLEAPISFDSPPGAELQVAVLVTLPDDGEDHPVDGSPISLRLYGPDGDATEAPGIPGSAPGRYVMRIEVPAGGARRLEIFLRGGSDFPIFLTEDPFTFKPMGAGTAQLWPAPVAAAPRAPVAVGTPATTSAANPAPQPQPVATPVPPAEPAPWLVPLALVAALAVLALVAVAAIGRTRSRGAAAPTSLRGS
jgi:hypothetical protein